QTSRFLGQVLTRRFSSTPAVAFNRLSLVSGISTLSATNPAPGSKYLTTPLAQERRYETYSGTADIIGAGRSSQHGMWRRQQLERTRWNFQHQPATPHDDEQPGGTHPAVHRDAERELFRTGRGG